MSLRDLVMGIKEMSPKDKMSWRSNKFSHYCYKKYVGNSKENVRVNAGA